MMTTLTAIHPPATIEIRQAGQAADFPRKLQFLFRPYRYKVAYGGRGGAKSWNFARALLLLAMARPLHILCARETQKSLADSVHKLLCDQIRALNIGEAYRVTKNAITCRNGSDFFYAGLHHNVSNIKSIEACDIVWVEEGQSVSEDSWQTLTPTIRKPGSEIWCSFNPVFEDDAVWRRFILRRPTNSRVVEINWRDNPWFPDVLAVERADLLRDDPEEEEHVYGGRCKTSVRGAIFGREMKACREQNRIGNVPIDRTKPVHTCWDLGHGDDTAIWFVQAYGGWFNVVDYYANHGQSIEHYMLELQSRRYVYGNHYLPHDAVDAIVHARLAGDRSKSIEMIMRESGMQVRVAPKLYVHDRINAARMILPQCRFDEQKCAEGLRGLRLYQWGPLTKLGVARREPLHDAASHPADAFCVLGVCVKQPPPDAPPAPRSPFAQTTPATYTPYA
jgi:phage terminase large subunit